MSKLYTPFMREVAIKLADELGGEPNDYYEVMRVATMEVLKKMGLVEIYVEALKKSINEA